MVSVPAAGTIADGVNFAVTGAVAPALTTRFPGAALNGGPLVVTELTVRGTAPVFLMLTGSEPERHTATLPRSRFKGDTLMWGSPPTPDKGTVTVGCARSLVLKIRLPLNGASAVGLKVIVTT